MAFAFQVVDGSGRAVAELWLGHLDRSYVLEEETCPVFDQVGYCYDCHTFVAVERLLTPEGIDRAEAADAKAWERYRHLPQPPLPAVVTRTSSWWDAVRRWRAGRRSSARCLQCFSTEITPVSAGRTIRHPVTGQALRLQTVSHLSLGMHWFYDPEGLPLPADVLLPQAVRNL